MSNPGSTRHHPSLRLLLESDGGNLPHLLDTPQLPEAFGKWSKGLTISNRRYIDTNTQDLGSCE